MDALLGLIATVGLLALFFLPLWFLFVWVPKGGCRCRSQWNGRTGVRIASPNCPEHGDPYAAARRNRRGPWVR